MKRHDKDFFYKYMSAETASRTLDSLELRWSAPSTFNDPFDVQMDLRFDFDRATLGRRIVEEVDRVVFSDQEPTGDDAHPVFLGLKECWRNRAQFDREDMRRQAEILCSALDNQQHTVRDEAQRIFRGFLDRVRVLCVSEVADNLLMWAHYAELHRGAVLRFRCLPDINSTVCWAWQVSYSTDLPTFADLNRWVRELSGQEKREPEAIARKYLLTKSVDWAYEKEWRVFGKQDGADDGYVYRSILPEELDAVYLGCRMGSEIQSEIARRLTGRLAHVKLYKARKSSTRFALDFDLISASAS
jgi:hypothetical protein